MTSREKALVPDRCPTCKGKGWASQWRTYGHQEMHGYYYEKCDACEGTGLAAARAIATEEK